MSRPELGGRSKGLPWAGGGGQRWLRPLPPARECNRRRQVIAVLNDLYAAAFLQLYRVWKSQHKTVADSGFLLKGALRCALPPDPGWDGGLRLREGARCVWSVLWGPVEMRGCMRSLTSSAHRGFVRL